MQLWNRHTQPKDIVSTYIGRGTPWGNPYRVNEGYTQDEAADAYRARLARALAARDPGAYKLVTDLAGVENITCSCTPRKCHGDCFKEIWTIIRSEGVTPLIGVRKWVKLNGYDFGPATDGKDHINVYSKGKTRLGCMLTNMSDYPVTVPGEGDFRCMEGYWHWLSTGRKHDQLMDMNGFEAKAFAKNLPKELESDFKSKIREALRLRLEQSPKMAEALRNAPDLPFKHYYCYRDIDETVTFPLFDWVTNELEWLRKVVQGKITRCIIAGSRGINDPELLATAIDQSCFEIDEVVCGGAAGVDTLGETWAISKNKRIKYFYPGWETYGEAAGMIRNCAMGDYADCAIVIVKNHSKGSSQMYEYMKKLGKPVYRMDIP